MMRFYIFILFLVARVPALAQGWVLEADVYINHTQCAVERLMGTTVTFAGVSATPPASSSPTFVMKGTGSGNGTLVISATGTCTVPNDPSKPLPAFSESYSRAYAFNNCTSSTFQTDATDNVNLDGTLRFYPRMVVGVPDLMCNGIRLYSLTCALSVNVKWEVSNSATGPWYPVAGQSSVDITVTPAQLHQPAFGSNIYQTRWVRATSVVGTTSEPREVKIPLPAPTIALVSGNPPVCPDGEGSIMITHGNTTPPGVEFIYTVTQFVEQISGVCPSGYGTGHSLSQTDIDNLQGMCANAPSVNIGSATFCSGKIGNYRKTFTSANLSYTLLPGSGIEESASPGSGNYLKLLPGIYIVEVEAATPSGIRCVCRFIVRIPPPTVSLSIPENSIIPKSPSCTNGNDGSVILAVNVRGKFDGNSDIRYTLQKLRNGSYTDYNGRQNILTNLTASKLSLLNLESGDYKLIIWDRCINYPSVVLFVVPAGPPFIVSRTSILPSCINDANGDGIAESGDGTLVLIPPDMPGKTYTYKLYSSGGTLLHTKANTGSGNGVFADLINTSYYSTVATSNLCKSDSVLSSISQPLAIAPGVLMANAICSDENDGRITVTNISKQSGTIKYSYSLRDQLTNNIVSSGSNLNVSPEFQIPVGLGRGTYSLTITDQCIAAPNNIVFKDLVVQQPLTLAIDPQADIKIPCFDGVTNIPVLITFREGLGPYLVDVRKDNSSLQGFPREDQTQKSVSLSNLPLGIYTVVVRDACGVEKSMSFKVQSLSAAPLSASISRLTFSNGLHLTCPEKNDGRIVVEVSGGVQGGLLPRYRVELLNNHGAVLINNTTNGANENGTISPGVTGENGVSFLISGLAGNISYQIRVSDFNTDPGSCSKVFSRDQAGHDLSLDSPEPLSLRQIDPLRDFTGAVVHRDELFLKCKYDSNVIFSSIADGGNTPYTAELRKALTESDKPGTVVRSRDQLVAGGFSFSGLGAGYYTVSIRDAQGCSALPRNFVLAEADQNFRLTRADAFEFAPGIHTSCYSRSDGQIKVETSGGVGDKTYYLFSNSDTVAVAPPGNGHVFGNLHAGDGLYIVKAVDELGCVARLSPGVANIIQLNAAKKINTSWRILSKTEEDYEIPCFGDTALISFKSQQGIYPHLISIDGQVKSVSGTGDSAVFHFVAGTFQVSVKDKSGCEGDQININLIQPPGSVNAAIELVESPACIGGQGKIKVSATGGVSRNGLYDFVAVGPGFADTLSGTSASFNCPADGLNPQSYSLKALDRNGCEADTLVVMFPNPDPLKLRLDLAASPSCFNGTDARIEVSAINAKFSSSGSIRFLLAGGHLGDGVRSASSSGSSFVFDGLQATDQAGVTPYRIWVEDANECADTAFQFLPMIGIASRQRITSSVVSTTGPLCESGSDGSVLIEVKGGEPPYRWAMDTSDFSAVPSNGQFWIRSLAAGKMTLLVKDANYKPDQPSCIQVSTVEIPEGRRIRIDEQVSRISCNGGNDGAIDLNLSLDNKPAGELTDHRFSVEWRRTGEDEIISRSPHFASLLAGSYTAYVEYGLDSASCTASKEMNVEEPFYPLEIQEIKTFPSSCGSAHDGKAVVRVGGGWVDAVNHYRVDNQPWSSVRGLTLLLTNLSPGEHLLTIAQGGFACEVERRFTIGRSTLGIEAQTISPTCPFAADGIIIVSGNGPELCYSLNGSTFQTEVAFDSLRAGIYEVSARKVADHSCVSEPVFVTMVDPEDCGHGPLTIRLIEITPATCNSSQDGALRLRAEGGVPPYRFFWDGVEGDHDGYKAGLPASIHTVTVKDRMNKVETVTIAIGTKRSLAFDQISSASTCVSRCDGGVSILASGGSGSYAIMWNDGINTFERSEICAGEYSFTIADATAPACLINSELTIAHLPEISVSVNTVIPPRCHNGSDGSINVTATGGTSSLQCYWSNGVTGTTLEDLAAGEYTVTVTDKISLCSAMRTVNVPNPLPLVVETVVSPPSCHGTTDGSVYLQIRNSSLPSVQWHHGDRGIVASGLRPGSYGFTITSVDGCAVTGEALVPQQPELQVTCLTQDVQCYSACDGSASVQISGGAPPYAVKWDNGTVLTLREKLCSGSYDYLIIDKNNCSLASVVEIGTPPLIELSHRIDDVSCFRGSDGSINAIVDGGIPPYRFEWNDSPGTSSATMLSAGNYNLRVSDARHCSVVRNIRVGEPQELLLANALVHNPSCSETADGSIVLTAMGGVGPYEYLWTDGVSTRNREGLLQGRYLVQIQDQKGCRSAAEFYLTPSSRPDIVNAFVQDPACFGDSNGSVSVEVIGGAAPLTYEWSDGTTMSRIDQKPAGLYTIAVTDANNCSATRQFRLEDPEEPVVAGIPGHMKICTGGTAIAVPEGEWTRYYWEGPHSFIQTEQRLEAGLAGVYTLTVWDSRHCPVSASMEVEVSPQVLALDLLRISEPLAFEPVVFIDISNPVADFLEWLVPESDLVVSTYVSSNSLELIFLEPGEYEIGMRGQLGNCVSEVIKTVSVIENNREGGSNGRQSTSASDLRVEVFPNPASNTLQIKIDSPGRDAVHITLRSGIENRVVLDETLDGLSHHFVQWDVSMLTNGFYHLTIESKGVLRSERIVVMR